MSLSTRKRTKLITCSSHIMMYRQYRSHASQNCLGSSTRAPSRDAQSASFGVGVNRNESDNSNRRQRVEVSSIVGTAPCPIARHVPPPTLFLAQRGEPLGRCGRPRHVFVLSQLFPTFPSSGWQCPPIRAYAAAAIEYLP